MSLVEKELTQKNVEQARNNPEFQKRREREQKMMAVSPDLLDVFKADSVPIEQVYLSHPDEEFSLRVRAKYSPEGTTYMATLKDGGEIVDGVLDRLEVEEEISQEAYEYYANNGLYPHVRKLRSEPLPGLSIDFIEGMDTPVVEFEGSDLETSSFATLLKTGLVDMTDSTELHNEVIAHRLHQGEVLKPSAETLESLSMRMFKDMVATYTLGYKQVVVGVSGMSGSGKTTVVHDLEKALIETFGEEFRPLVLSSDDYHRGKKWLESEYGAPWTNWDDPRVYNTAELADDLKKLSEGEPVMRKHFDFGTEEVVYDEIIDPRPFVIVEGLFAGSPDLQPVRHLHYEVPTGIATSVGRDVRRLILENRANGSIGSPEARLKYQLETALPTYLEQDRPRANAFSRSSRPLAERAFMLAKLR